MRDAISEEQLYEVFGSGQRHVIGAEGDPDDVETDDAYRLPLHVLQLSQLLRTVGYAVEPDEDQNMNIAQETYELRENQEEELDDSLDDAATVEQTV